MATTVWDNERWTPRPHLTEDITADACIIGLGGAGLAAARELATHGADVVGVDAGSIGGGAAGRNAGFLLAGLADFFHVTVARFGGDLASAIYRHTLTEVRRLAEEFPDDVSLTGSLRIADGADENGDCDAHLAALQTHGFAAEPYSGPEGTGILIPEDGIYQPKRAVRREAAAAVAGGVRLFEQTPVSALQSGEVKTRDGRVHCHLIIVAVDGGLEFLLPELTPRVRTARLQMLATASARDVSFPRPVYRRQGFEYWRQLPTGEIALGGFRDHGGESEWTRDPEPGGLVQELLERFLREEVGTSAPVTHRWAAGVSYTPQRLPILEEVRERVYAVGAYSGTGNILSRLCGRAAARVAGGQASPWAGLLQAAGRVQRVAGDSSEMRR